MRAASLPTTPTLPPVSFSRKTASAHEEEGSALEASTYPWHETQFAPSEMQRESPAPRASAMEHHAPLPRGARPYERYQSPFDTVCLDARSTLITVRRFELPPYLASGFTAEAQPDTDVWGRPRTDHNVEASQMHRVLDFYRDGKVPVTMTESEIAALKLTAKYLDDQPLLFELKEMLPLRQRVKQCVGTEQHAPALFQLATALELAGEPNRAERKRKKAHEVVRQSVEQLLGDGSNGQSHAYAGAYGQTPAASYANECWPLLPKEFVSSEAPIEQAQLIDASNADMRAVMVPWLIPTAHDKPAGLFAMPMPPMVNSDSNPSSSHSLATAMDFFSVNADTVRHEEWMDAAASDSFASCTTEREDTPIG